ncbi:ribulose-phosphate 3-epimerase [bacterium]|nr:ribulose-phosphate 3-epimerase [bacterium]
MNSISKHQVRILPSLLAADFSRLGEEAQRALSAGAHGLHADVMDGQFVPPITFGADITRAVVEATGARVDAHLMIVEPEKQIEAFAKAGVKGITVHVEATAHLHRVLGMIRDAGCEAGVSLNPATPVTESLRYVMPLVDRVLIMTVNPGWGGQKFIPEGLDKVHKVARLIEAHESNARLQVDGGVTPENAGVLVRHGADELVAGSAVYKGDVAANIAAFESQIRAALTV